jgi:hypothetical protein
VTLLIYLPHLEDRGEGKKVAKLSPYQAVEVHRVLEDTHMFYTAGSKMTAKLSSLRAGLAPPHRPRNITGTHLCQRLIQPQGPIMTETIR